MGLYSMEMYMLFPSKTYKRYCIRTSFIIVWTCNYPNVFLQKNGWLNCSTVTQMHVLSNMVTTSHMKLVKFYLIKNI